MPQITIKGLTDKQMRAISTPLIPKLAEAIGCPEDWLILELAHSSFYAGGEQVPGFPIVEVSWFDRTDEVRERFEYELSMIEQMGYVEYYLIVWDYVHYAKTHGVMVGPGRGSGAASIVAYAMDITTIDPIRYQLLFARFLNPDSWLS